MLFTVARYVFSFFLITVFFFLLDVPKFPKEVNSPLVVKEGDPIILECNPPEGVAPIKIYWMSIGKQIRSCCYLLLLWWIYLLIDSFGRVTFKMFNISFAVCVEKCVTTLLLHYFQIDSKSTTRHYNNTEDDNAHSKEAQDNCNY